jgi:two-component system cell cycle response regulator
MSPKGPRKPPTPVSPTTPAVYPEMPTVVRLKAERETLAAPTAWALVVYSGSALGRIFPISQGETVIGRSPSVAVALMDGEVSRTHARLVLESEAAGARITLEDLGSTNGTRVNGVSVQGTRQLHPGDRLGIGGHVMKLVAMDALERAFHETLLDLSTRDPLTGLANRGSSLAEFQNRFGLSVRYNRPLSVVMCDLDHFKQVNDTHGHGAGDFVLQCFGEHVRANLREADLAGRIGGEEFLMVLPETDLSGARQFAERLRKAVFSSPVALPSGPLEVACSLGVAERLKTDQEPGQLLARADAALYQAKADGRNRVCLS